MRMLHCPLRSYFNASRRLEGGKRRSSSVVAAWSCVRRIAARLRISGGRRRDLPVAKKRSVSDDAKERITNEKINYLFTPVKRQAEVSLPVHGLLKNQRRAVTSATSIATTASAITPVASQPRFFKRRLAVKRPMISGRAAISIITAMMGTEITPLITALQMSALTGSIAVKLSATPIVVAATRMA